MAREKERESPTDNWRRTKIYLPWVNGIQGNQQMGRSHNQDSEGGVLIKLHEYTVVFENTAWHLYWALEIEHPKKKENPSQDFPFLRGEKGKSGENQADFPIPPRKKGKSREEFSLFPKSGAQFLKLKCHENVTMSQTMSRNFNNVANDGGFSYT